MSFTTRFGNGIKKALPSPFTIAILLTLLTFVLAIVCTRPAETGILEYTADMALAWEAGLWNPGGGGLYFAFQMMLMLVLGHILALSRPFEWLINQLTDACTTTARAALIVTFSTVLISLFNWGLGLIFGAILARKVGEVFTRSNKALNYGLIGAAAYSGLMVWHGGLSGSAPLKAAEPGNVQSMVDPNLAGLIPDSIDPALTLYSPMNITVSLLLILLLPALMYLVGKKSSGAIPEVEPLKVESEVEEEAEGAERLDASKIFAKAVGVLILFLALYKALIVPEEISLKFLTPNFINLSLLGFCLVFHSNIKAMLRAGDSAIKGAFGILLQFPFYFAIMGIMVASGLIEIISESMANNSTEFSLPIYTFFSAGLVNIFVPSGGGQWAVQGPIIINASLSLGLPLPKAIMALAYGDQLTNMLQPFWALPLLGITGLKAKQILPYTLVLFFAGMVIFLLGLVIF
ncbi:MAG: TIGR00366 family protein [Crocinitomicaceae bacterium]|nr:TIGR00366 family protein [Crocinitomicaceae bacterium]